MYSNSFNSLSEEIAVSSYVQIMVHIWKSETAVIWLVQHRALQIPVSTTNEAF